MPVTPPSMKWLERRNPFNPIPCREDAQDDERDVQRLAERSFHGDDLTPRAKVGQSRLRVREGSASGTGPAAPGRRSRPG